MKMKPFEQQRYNIHVLSNHITPNRQKKGVTVKKVDLLQLSIFHLR